MDAVPCAYDETHDKMTFKAFVFEDSTKTCHRILDGECKLGRHGTDCDPPTGSVVPCPPPP